MTLFAMSRYTDAAAPLVRGARRGAGLGLGHVHRALPECVGLHRSAPGTRKLLPRQHRRSAPARFVLAYLYLTQGSTSAAVQTLKRVVALQPKDTISAQLIKRLDPTYSPPRRVPPAASRRCPATGAAELTPTSATVKEGRFEGAWSAKPDQDTAIT